MSVKCHFYFGNFKCIFIATGSVYIFEDVKLVAFFLDITGHALIFSCRVCSLCYQGRIQSNKTNKFSTEELS